MKKPYLDEWQRRMIIENYGVSGPLLYLNLQLNIFLRNITMPVIDLIAKAVN
jgi:hypothetical protein